MTTILQDFALTLIALVLFGYCAYHLGCLQASYDELMQEPHQGFLSENDRELKAMNEGFTDCEIFD